MDEAITFARSRMDVSALIENAIRRYHNPTYFLLIHYTMAFGDSEWVLRFPSALSGIVKALGVCALGAFAVGGREGKWVGLLAATLVLLMPSQLWYDQEARMYALLGLFAVLAECALFYLLTHLEVASRFWFERLHLGHLAWGSYVCASTVALYLHNTAVLLVGTCAVASSLGLIAKETRKKYLRNWTLAHFVIGVLSIPWLPTLWAQSEQMREMGWWAVEPDRLAVVSTLVDLFGFGIPKYFTAIALLVLATFGFYKLWPRREVALAVLVLTLGGPTLLGLVTLYQPMFGLRLMLWSAVPFAVLLSVGLVALRPVWLRNALIAFAIPLGVFHLNDAYYCVRKKPDWSGAVIYLSERARLNDAIWATSGTEARSLAYYLERDHRRAIPLTIDYNHEKRGSLDRARLSSTTNIVWTICGRDRPNSRAVRASLEAIARRTERRSFGPDLVVERYELLPESVH